MAEKAYVADYGPTASCTMRLCEPLQKRGKPYVVCGDSWFTSVKTVEALTNMGLFYSGVLKGATYGTPSSWLKKHAFDAASERGGIRMMKLQVKRGDDDEFIYIIYWNEPGPRRRDWKKKGKNKGVPMRKMFLVNWGTTFLSEAERCCIKKRIRVKLGVVEDYEFPVPWNAMIKEYFEGSPMIDIANHRRWSPLPPRPAGGWHWRLCEP